MQLALLSVRVCIDYLERVAQARQCRTAYGKKKIGYVTEFVAKQVAEGGGHLPKLRAYGENRRKTDHRGRYNHYRCNNCGLWHIGKPSFEDVLERANHAEQALRRIYLN